MKKNKRTRGRPKTAEASTYTEVLQVRVTPEQRAAWTELARAAGHVHVGPFIRHCVEVATGRAVVS